MSPWEDAEEILALVKDEANWTPELFERCRNNTLVNPCIFNQVRAVLPPEQYQRFDDAYCLSGRPEQKEMIISIRNGRRKKQRQEEMKYNLRQSSDKQLLILLNQLKESGQL